MIAGIAMLSSPLLAMMAGGNALPGTHPEWINRVNPRPSAPTPSPAVRAACIDPRLVLHEQ